MNRMKTMSLLAAAIALNAAPAVSAQGATGATKVNGATIPARAASGTGAAGSCLLQLDVVGPAGTYNNTATATGTATP